MRAKWAHVHILVALLRAKTETSQRPALRHIIDEKGSQCKKNWLYIYMNKLMIYETMRYKYCYCEPKRVDCWDQASSEKMEDKIPSGMLQGSLSCAEELNGIRVYIYICIYIYVYICIWHFLR